MRLLSFFKCLLLTIVLSWAFAILADNQTPNVSPIFSGQDLPFRVRIKLLRDKQGNPFLLPNGLQSYNLGVHEGKWLFINGRTNGLHGFNDDSNNFPPLSQNRNVYVVDVKQRTVAFRSLTEIASGLTQDQIDILSVTSAESYQSGQTLYIVGGYGFRTCVNDYATFDFLTAINIPGLMHWVTHPDGKDLASKYIRHISNPIFKVTGGALFKLNHQEPTLLVFGQDFKGAYFSDQAVQIYIKRVRRFKIHDNGSQLSVEVLLSTLPNKNFRRRDLNVVPIIKYHAKDNRFHYGLVAFAGVFTPSGGAWTVPVTITANGKPSMANPNNCTTFKQGMNNYTCPFLSLYSKKTQDMYTVFFGGISFEYFQDGLQQDSELPFINQVTTIKLDKHDHFTQYIMDAEYPIILSTQSNPGNRLLFGAGANFIPANGLKALQYQQNIFKLDLIKKPLVIGYIVGGIQSTLMNTNTMSDSAASPYIFKVILEPISKDASQSSRQ